MILHFSATNAMNNWLKEDLPHMPNEQGKQAGIHSLYSDNKRFSWQLHIIDNDCSASYKTIIACEAFSRFTVFFAVHKAMTKETLTSRFKRDLQYALVDCIEYYQLLPKRNVMYLIDELSQLTLDTHWAKNTDLSVNGHISDAGLWVGKTLQDRSLQELSPELASELAVYLNGQPKRVKGKTEFIPCEQLLNFCQKHLLFQYTGAGKRTTGSNFSHNIVNLSDYRKTKSSL